jgi:Flp pilus assembly protein TadD
MTELTTILQQAEELESQGKYNDAINLYKQIAAEQPKDTHSRSRLAVIYFTQGNYEKAERYARETTKISPKNITEQVIIADSMWCLGKRDFAIRHLNYILQLVPNTPEMHNKIGTRYYSLGDLKNAVKHFDFARQLTPENLKNLKDLAKALQFDGRYSESKEIFEEILTLTPDDAEIHFQYGCVLLSEEDSQKAWSHFYWRHKCVAPHFSKFTANIPQWTGQDLTGKSILVTWEQGIGDTIHFVRYIKDIIKLGARIVLDCRPLMIDLLSHRAPSIQGDIEIHNTEDPQPQTDYIISMMDIPLILHSINISQYGDIDFPYLTAPASLKAQFQTLLSPYKSMKLGLNWQGNPGFKRDNARSIPLKAFSPLTQYDNVKLVSLQAIHGTDQIKDFPGEIIDLEEHLLSGDEGLSRLAAAIEAVDLVISCDSAVAHLAGALNKKTILLIPTIPDWRWGLKGTKSKLYPSIEIFRCPEKTSWLEALAQTPSIIHNAIDKHNANIT